MAVPFRLVTRCPRCADRPKWNVGRVSECHCGQSLLEVEATALNGPQLALLQAMAARLPDRRSGRDALSSLDGLTLPDVVNMLKFLGELATVRVDERAACALEADDLPELMSAGLQTLAALPGSFSNLLDRVERRSGASATNLKDRYGIPLIRWLGSDHPYARVLRPIFEDHASVRGLSPTTGRKTRSGWWFSDWNSRRHGLEERDLERLRAATDWDGPPTVKRQDILVIQRERGTVLNQTEARALLGVQRQTFVRIQRTGIIEATWPQARGGNDFFYRSELEDLVDRLRMEAPAAAGMKEDLVQVTRVGGGQSLASLIRLMMDGRLRCAGFLQDRQGLHRLLVRRDDLPVQSGRSAKGTMVGSSICRTIDITPDLLARLRTAGHLKVIAGVPFQATSIDEVAEFSRRFVSCNHLARALRLEDGVVRDRLRRNGISGLLEKKGANVFPWLDVVRAIPDIVD